MQNYNEYLNNKNQYDYLANSKNVKGEGKRQVEKQENIRQEEIQEQEREQRQRQNQRNTGSQNGGALNSNVNKKNSIDVLHFWGRQFADHAFMLHLMIVDKPLKDEAMILHEAWSKYLSDTFESLNIEKDKMVLDDEDFEKINTNNFNFDKAFKLIEELRDYKEKVKQIVDLGNWIGFVYPSFVKHILDELNHSYAEMRGEYISDKEKMAFWDQSNAEEAGLSSHLLDPALENDSDIKKANDFYHRVINKLTEDEKNQMISLSINNIVELDKMVKKTKEKIESYHLKSVIHPALIQHIDREDQRCMYELEKIKYKNRSQ